MVTHFAGAEGSGSSAQGFHAGERLAFEPLEERAACRRYIGEAFGSASVVERRHRIAATRHGDELALFRALGGMASRRHGALVEGRDLEGAERAVPDERRRVV